MGAPDFWNDSDAAQKAIATLKSAKSIVTDFGDLEGALSDAEVLHELADQEGDASAAAEVSESIADLEHRLESFELKSLLSGEYDSLGAIIEINAGAGGTESMDWASMLFRMYQRWAERESYATDVIDFQPGQEAGIKSASMGGQGRLRLRLSALGDRRSPAGPDLAVRRAGASAHVVRLGDGSAAHRGPGRGRDLS